MASLGSRRAFGYSDDTGREWAVNIDETHGEVADLGFEQNVADATNEAGRFLRVTGKIPLAPRYILTTQTNGDTVGRTQKFYVGSTDAAIWGNQVDITVDGVEYRVTSKVGEHRRVPPATDTGLDDGDADEAPAV